MNFTRITKHVNLRSVAATRGFTLVEMMVGIVVSLIGTLAMMSAFAVFERDKRTTTANGDAQQNGSYSLFELERQVRTAGSGMIQGKAWGLYGCAITSPTIPLTGLTAPFATFPTAVRAIPVLVQSGGVDGLGNALPDVIQVISGNPAIQVFREVVQTATATNVILDPNYSNNVGLLPKEYMLGVSASGTCTTGKITTLTDPGTITFSNTVGTGFAGSAYLFDLGENPIMSLFGISTASGDRSLVRYDMTTGQSSTVADGVYMLKVLYGVDDGANGGAVDDNIIDEWVKPDTGGTWGYASLMAGGAPAAALISRIKAIRIAVVAQTLLPEKDPVAGTSATMHLFSDLPALEATLTVDQHYHYRVYDTTIPLRNSLIQKFY